jgi:hypothetical protein
MSSSARHRRDVEPIGPVFRHRQIDVECGSIGVPRFVERLGRRDGIRRRRIEQQTIGEDAAHRCHRERATRQRLTIDLEALKAPRSKRERAESKAE